ncbi:MAG: EamA family transporter [Alphaproteobacteria bacterium]
MSTRDVIGALFVALIWGSNFCVVKTTLNELPPFLFLMFRFLLVSLPFIWFFPRPKVPWKYLLGIGLTQWILHFGLLTSALSLGMTAGMGSLLLQTQAIFTIAFSAFLYGFRPQKSQLSGITIAFIGLALIAYQVGGASGGVLAFGAIFASAISNSVANLIYRRMGTDVDMTSVIVWSGLIPPIPMFLLSLGLDGWDEIVCCVTNISGFGISGVIYTAVVSTLLAANVWGTLMNRNEPGKVIPFSLLIPVVGITAGVIALGEEFTLANFLASLLIISGLVINQWGPSLSKILSWRGIKLQKTIPLQE